MYGSWKSFGETHYRWPTLLPLLLLSIIGSRSMAQIEQLGSTPIEFSIEAQSVPAALSEFAHQAQVQFLFISEGYEHVRANAVAGTYSRPDAIELLLAGTGLKAKFAAPTLVSVTHDDAEGSVTNRPEHLHSAPQEASAHSPVNRTPGTVDVADPKSASAAARPIEEIVVTGSNIRGVGSTGAMTLTFTREELAQTGFSTMEDLFQNLPQNLGEVTPVGAIFDGTSRVARSNTQGATGVSLRGLGPGSTLVLLNGRRRPGNIRGRVFDVSAIPLSMIERVEIVTGGNSAVYGSDAVAGVVNIVTRAAMDGAKSEIYYGESSAGGERLNVNQTFGRNSARGSLIVGYDYRKDKELDATATGVVKAPSPTGVTPLPGLFRIQAPSTQHTGLLAGNMSVANNIEVYGDLHYTSDKNERGSALNRSGVSEFVSVSNTDSRQYSVVGGIRFEGDQSWHLDIAALHGVVDNTTGFVSQSLPVGSVTTLDIPAQFKDDDKAKLSSFSAIADGPIYSFAAGTASAALGLEYRDERYDRMRTDLPTGEVTPGEDRGRHILSVFGEVHLPLSIASNRSFRISLAGRYDDYSDFGGTFNPQVGLDWQPVANLTIRGSYSEAFRAPDLATLALPTQVVVRAVTDPLDPTGGTAATTITELGGNPSLDAEEADTWTVGFDWQPAEAANVSMSYFNISYQGRIDQAALSDTRALPDEHLYPGLINRAPTSQDIATILGRLPDLSDLFNLTGLPFDPNVDDPFSIFPNIVLFDNRRNNIAIEDVEGLDVKADLNLDLPSGTWALGLNGTYYLDSTRRITPTAEPIERLNQPGKPVDLKLRGRIGWSRAAWSANAFVNYVDRYYDTNAPTITKIDSWTTIDLTVRLSGSSMSDTSLLKGYTFTLGVLNLLDEDPPAYWSNTSALGYDAVNANPLGRFASLRVAKEW